MRPLVALVSLCASLALTPALAPAAPVPPSGAPANMRFDYAYQLLRSGDESRDRADFPTALSFYEEATKEYRSLLRDYPDWDPAVTRFRADYCGEELRKLKRRLNVPTDGATTNAVPPATNATAVASAPPPPPAGAPDLTPPQPGAPTPPAPRPSPPPERRPSAGDAPAARALTNQALTQLKAGKPEEARAILMESLHLNPDDPTTRLLAATVQCQLGQYEDASYVIDELISENPTNPLPHLAMGAAELGMGDADAAEAHVRTALQLAPDLAEGHYNLARLLLLRGPGEYTNADVEYRRSRDLGGPADPELEMQLGAALPVNVAPGTGIDAPPADTTTNAGAQP